MDAEITTLIITFAILVGLLAWFIIGACIEDRRIREINELSDYKSVPNNVSVKSIDKTKFSTLISKYTQYDKGVLRPKDQSYFICGKREEWENMFLRSKCGDGLITRPLDVTKSHDTNYPIEDTVIVYSTGITALNYVLTYGNIKEEWGTDELLKKIFKMNKFKSFFENNDTSLWMSETPYTLTEEFKKYSEMYRSMGLNDIVVVLTRIGKHVSLLPIPIKGGNKFYEVILKVNFNTNNKKRS